MNHRIYVWDRLVRIFHWSLVVLFATSYLTGESESQIHIYSGYAIVALLLGRIVWGFIGSRYARFTDFVYSPKQVLGYVGQIRSGSPAKYLGHNPLGGLMVFALLVTLLTTTFSGLMLYGVEEGKGPFAQVQIDVDRNQSALVDDDGQRSAELHGHEESLWKEIHETAVNVMLLLVLLHIVGVIFASRIHRESLVKAMLTGYKDIE